MKLNLINIRKFFLALPMHQIIYKVNSVPYSQQTLGEEEVTILNINKYFNYMRRARI